ncbi:MAG: ribonuclease III [Tepidiformaceae bacterium]
MPLAPAAAYEVLLERLGVQPLPAGLLGEALTHSSFLNESDAGAPSNERLEFLGDAILGMVIGERLFSLLPAAGEGDLTRMRADIVRGSTLARAATRLGLGEYLVLGRGEEAAGGRERERNLAGLLEAIIGAVYTGSGYRASRTLCLRLLEPELRQARREGSRLDAKSSLQHLVQARWHEPPEYVTVDEASDGGGRRFTVEVKVGKDLLGRGSGPSKREAQQQAAADAVAALSGAPRLEAISCT